MMSCAASHAISKNYAELLLWKALGQLLPRSPSVKCICSTRAFVTQRRWHWPRVRGLNPTVASHCEYMRTHCILVWFNLDQVSSRRLYKGGDASGKWRLRCKRIRGVINKAMCLFWVWAEGVLGTQSVFSYCLSLSVTRVCWLFSVIVHVSLSVVGTACEADYAYLLFKITFGSGRNFCLCKPKQVEHVWKTFDLVGL